MRFLQHSLIASAVVAAAAFLLPAPPAQAQVISYQYSGPYGCKGCAPSPSSQERLGAGNTAVAGMGVQRGGQPGLFAGRRVRRVGPAMSLPNPLPYDLLLQGAHVIDPKNGVDQVTDVAIKDGKIAAVGEHLNPAQAAKTIDLQGYYLTPGLIDINLNAYDRSQQWRTYANNYSIWPDGFTFRSGVTTVVDAGSSGWRNFEDFKEHVIDRSKTHILAFLNVAGDGLQPPTTPDDRADLAGAPTGWMAERYPDTIVGILTSGVRHLRTGEPDLLPYQQAIRAAKMAKIPVMVDFSADGVSRPLDTLLTQILRPHDIYSGAYAGLQNEQNPGTLQPRPFLMQAQSRGIYFDTGNGAHRFRFRTAIPLIKAGFLPNSISTGLNGLAMNGAARDLNHVMNTFLAMGLSLQQVVADTSWHPAQEINRPQLGNLSVGAPADVAVFSLEHGKYGFIDSENTTLASNRRLVCELTVLDGQVVYDLDGLSMDPWNDLHPSSNPQMAVHWTTYRARPILPELLNPRQPYASALQTWIANYKSTMAAAQKTPVNPGWPPASSPAQP